MRGALRGDRDQKQRVPFQGSPSRDPLLGPGQAGGPSGLAQAGAHARLTGSWSVQAGGWGGG